MKIYNGCGLSLNYVGDKGTSNTNKVVLYNNTSILKSSGIIITYDLETHLKAALIIRILTNAGSCVYLT